MIGGAEETISREGEGLIRRSLERRLLRESIDSYGVPGTIFKFEKIDEDTLENFISNVCWNLNRAKKFAMGVGDRARIPAIVSDVQTDGTIYQSIDKITRFPENLEIVESRENQSSQTRSDR